ncbi:CynX/NimT family MFS transporter [Streptomyces zagrosensis]|uniref:CP family cyanate transporter-like MFS transporter n=1 Tax=Streptomyces zagrosensis TaxID=1042984 RepID=A0A7W9Q5X8_9ACTN|nr:MFS transporter [Streptomyces zagrosensis]MBB5934211.1 CP family cyanate transporter-like MFS transporter [Streptomyces zagrosensis]
MSGPNTTPDARLIDAEEDLVPAPPVAVARRTLRAHPALLLVGIVLASLNMRAALAAVSPLLSEISDDFGLAATATSLVTTIPLIFMGLASPLAPKLARRFGTETALLGALVLLCGGILLRVAPPVVTLFVGSAFVGTAIALLNVLMPGLVKRDFPDRAAAMTALYSTSMIIGATTAAAAAVPLENALGSWRGSLASWALLAAFAALLWVPQAVISRRGTQHGQPAATPAHPTTGANTTTDGTGTTGTTTTTDTAADSSRRLSRTPLAWQITLFMGSQSLVAYVVIAWLPTVFTDHGMSKSTAGLVFAYSTLLQGVGSFVVPLLAGRMPRQRMLAVTVATLMASGVVGLLIAPVGGAWLWATLLGIGQGGALGLALTMMVLRARDAHTAARLSGMAQTWGYLLAAAGPLALGAVHQVTDGWTLPLLLLLGVCVGLAALGLGAGRNLKV